MLHETELSERLLITIHKNVLIGIFNLCNSKNRFLCFFEMVHIRVQT